MTDKTPYRPSPTAGMGGMWMQDEFRLRQLTDLKKQGKFGSDAPASREALYSCMREHGNGADEPKSPTPFSNEIRTALLQQKNRKHFKHRGYAA